MNDNDISRINVHKSRGKSIDELLIDVFTLTLDRNSEINIAKSLEEKKILGEQEKREHNKTTSAYSVKNDQNANKGKNSNLFAEKTVKNNVGLKSER